MYSDVEEYVKACPHCQRNKSTNRAPPGKLTPLPTPAAPWDSVSMDFIQQLPRTKTGFDAILVVVCRLTKMVHIIPTTNECTAEGFAKLYRDHIWKLHGVPLDIVTDRGTQFNNKFIRALHELLGSKQLLSTAFHPQTDGQTERVNRVLEDLLSNYVGGRQDDWDEYLAAAEFAINNSYHSSTGSTPFRLWTGRDPNLPATIIPGKMQRANEFADQMIKGLAEAKKSLDAARQRMKSYTDKRRRHEEFKEGDLVMLSTKNLKLKMPKGGTMKFMPRWIGPFPIIQYRTTREGPDGPLPISKAFRLELPEHMKVHNVFHVSLLKKYHPGREPLPVPLLYEDGEYFEIDRILDDRVVRRGRARRGKREYLIRWEGFGSEYDSWEPEEEILQSASIVEDQYWQYMGKEVPTFLAVS